MVEPSEVIELAVCAPAAEIAGAVEAGAGSIGETIGNKPSAVRSGRW